MDDIVFGEATKVKEGMGRGEGDPLLKVKMSPKSGDWL